MHVPSLVCYPIQQCIRTRYNVVVVVLVLVLVQLVKKVNNYKFLLSVMSRLLELLSQSLKISLIVV